MIFISNIRRKAEAKNIPDNNFKNFEIIGEENYVYFKKKYNLEKNLPYKIIWLRNLDPSLNSEHIKKYFNKYGSELSVAIPKNEKSEELFQKYKSFLEFCTEFVDKFHEDLCEIEEVIDKAVAIEPDPIQERIALSIVGENYSKYYCSKENILETMIDFINKTTRFINF